MIITTVQYMHLLPEWLSSQDELNKLYIKTKKSDIDARDTKIASTIEQLEKKQAIKDSLVTYAKIQKWKTPYPGCQTKMTGKSVTLPGSKKVDVDTYERNIEADIRRLKSGFELCWFLLETGRRISLTVLKPILRNALSLVQKRCIQRRILKISISRHGSKSSLTKDMHQ